MKPGQETQRATSSDALEAFALERGLPVEFLLEHGVHIEESGEREGWLAIPWRTWMGTEWYTRHRNMYGGKPRYLDNPGSSIHIYNPNGAGPHSRVVFICEGELDTLTLTYLGYDAIGMSGTDKFGHDFFQALVPLLFTGAKVIIAVDNDQAGGHALAAISKAFPKATVLTIPEEVGKDIGDWHVVDRKGLEAALERATA